MHIKVSVIVPVYNTIHPLERCIRSIIMQTLSEIELIIVDDGSTDGSGEMADAYAQKDPRIRVIHQANAGVDAARNTGIATAKGNYITFVDSDDYTDEKLYEVMYDAAEESNADVVSSSMYRVWDHKKVLVQSADRIVNLNEIPRAAAIDRCVFGDYRYRMSACGKLYKKSLLNQYDIRFWGNRMEDAIFNILVLMVADKVRILSDPLYYYHKRPGSLTTTTATDPLYPIRQVSMIRQIQDFGNQYGILDRIEEMLPQYYLRFLKSAMVSVKNGDNYPYIYSTFKKLYNEDPNFKVLLARIKTPQNQVTTLKGRVWAIYRRLFAWTCSQGWLRIAAFLYRRQQKPWEPEI